MTRYIVLGRFQPFHKGHEFLVNSALELCDQTSDELVIAIGSSSKGWESDNPWTYEERKSIIESWLNSTDNQAEIVGIEDINDPPNWVSHATKFHGVGVLVTSDKDTYDLYQQSGFEAHLIDLSDRDNLEGWRVRQTALMLSTVYDDDAVASVLSSSIPEIVVKWLIDNDAIYRLSTMVSGVSVG